jgi:hypothetical protein
MINLNNISEVDINTKEGKLFIAAIAVLTTLKEQDLQSKKWGRSVDANQGLKVLCDLANKMFSEKTYRTEKITKLKKERSLKGIKNPLG